MGYAVIIGGANIDICGIPSSDFVPNDSNPGKITMTYGGVARNIAQLLCQLGIKVVFISAFGDDALSQGMMSSCEKLGMDISHSCFLKNRSGSVYNFITDKNGDMIAAVNDMEIYSEINRDFIKERLDIINGADMCFIDANNTESTLEYFMKNCRVPIFTDPVSSVKAVKLKGVLPYLYAIKPNAMEASVLTGIDVTDEKSAGKSAEAFLSLGIKRVYISLGGMGVYASDGETSRLYEPIKTPIVNTNGAGDSFTSAIIYSYLSGYSFSDGVRLGLAASSMCLRTDKTVNENINAETLKALAFKI